ncbi:MAG: ATP-binding protein [Hyphomicrobiales bacterium]
MSDSPTHPVKLEELVHLDRPAWLWDSARWRVVWANPEGLAYFGAESLFELVERHFGRRDENCTKLSETSAHLAEGVPQSITFKGGARGETLALTCYAHPLGDGRFGLLAVANPPAPETVGDASLAMNALPQAALIVAADGEITFNNLAAADLFAADALTSLHTLASDAVADTIIAHVRDDGAASQRLRAESVYGYRDFQLHAQEMGDGDTPGSIMVTLEDVTERRALERKLEEEIRELAQQLGAQRRAETRPETDGEDDPQSDWQKAETSARLQYGLRDGESTHPPVVRETHPADDIGTPVTHLTEEEQDTFRTIGAMLTEDAPQDQEEIPDSVMLLKVGSDAPEMALQQDDDHDPFAATYIPEDIPEEENEPASASKHEEPVQDETPPIDEDALTYAAVEAASDIVDGLPMPLLVHRDGALVHVNTLAAALLGYGSTPEALRADTLKRVFGDYAEKLMTPGSQVEFTSVPYESEPVRLLAEASVLAWPDGDAIQISLRPSHKEKLVEIAVSAPVEETSATTAPSSEPDDNELSAMLNTATDGVITIDKTCEVLSLNASAEALLGYHSADVKGRSLAEFLADDGGDILEAYIADLSESGFASAFNDGREVFGVEKNGGKIPLFLTLGRLSDKGDETKFCVVLRDLSTWKNSEDELRLAKEAAERASAQKSEFLANISHELRTPLNAILGFSEVMKTRKFGDIGNERYAGYVNDIHTSGSHLLSLINDLLDLSKIEAGKIELNFTSVELEEVVEQSVGLIQDKARDARVVVRTNLGADVPGVVADHRSMRQIVLNLLTNAVKFTSPGGQVAISSKLEDTGEVVLKIKDTGRGMTTDELRRAMEPFSQVEEAGGLDTEGTGLGLPLTKALTEANRAQFAIASEPGKGTLATITFPVTRVLTE